MNSPTIPSGFNLARDPSLGSNLPEYLTGVLANPQADAFDETDCGWSGVNGGLCDDQLVSQALKVLGSFEEVLMIARHDALSSGHQRPAIPKKHKALRGVGPAEYDDLPVLLMVAVLAHRRFHSTRMEPLHLTEVIECAIKRIPELSLHAYRIDRGADGAASSAVRRIQRKFNRMPDIYIALMILLRENEIAPYRDVLASVDASGSADQKVSLTWLRDRLKRLQRMARAN